MARFGVLLVVLGFGSALLYFTDYQLNLMAWSESMQPWLGLGVGGAGVLLILIPMLRNKDTQQPAPAGPPPAGYGPPSGPQQMPMQQAVPQQGPQFGPRHPQGPPPQGGYGPPPQGPPPQYGPGQGPAPYGPPPGGGFGPQGGPPRRPRG